MLSSLDCHDGPDRFLADAVDLGASLDATAAQEDATSMTRVLSAGRQQYFSLSVRRLTLDFTPGESAIALWMMDIIQARLTALDRLLQQAVLPSAGTRRPRGRRTARGGIRLIKR